MPVSPARAAAFDILLRVETQNAYASELLHSERLDKLSAADRSLTTELVMGVLRWRSRLDEVITATASRPLSKLDPEVLNALRLATYQMMFLTRIPSRAAINESVELVKRAHKRSAVPFANAVLRKVSATISRVDDAPQATISHASIEALAASSAHPLWLVERWTRAYGLDAAFRICQYDQSVPVTAIRLRRPEADQHTSE